MRVFNAESVWDKEERQLIQILTIDGQEVDLETYASELDNETNENGIVEEVQEGINHGDDCTCEDCIENRKNIYLAEAVKYMFENELCPKHVFEMLGDVYDRANYEGYEEGYDDAKEDMKEWLED